MDQAYLKWEWYSEACDLYSPLSSWICIFVIFIYIQFMWNLCHVWRKYNYSGAKFEGNFNLDSDYNSRRHLVLRWNLNYILAVRQVRRGLSMILMQNAVFRLVIYTACSCVLVILEQHLFNLCYYVNALYVSKATGVAMASLEMWETAVMTFCPVICCLLITRFKFSLTKSDRRLTINLLTTITCTDSLCFLKNTTYTKHDLECSFLTRTF